MKPSRFLSTIITATALAGIVISSTSCGFVSKVIGKDKLNQGVIAYNQGQDAKALQLFESATKYMPDNATAWLYYGAALFKELRTLPPEEQKKKAPHLLEVYTKAMDMAGSNCKNKVNAIGYIASIYDIIGETDKYREWQLKRATDDCADNPLKATTFYSIAVGYWKIAYDESTRYADKAKLQAEPFHCRNFYFKPDKDKFDDALNKGMEYIEKSLAIDPEYTDALSYKSLLLREKQKATCNEADRKKFADEAEKFGKMAVETAKKKKEQAEAAAAAKEAKEASEKK